MNRISLNLFLFLALAACAGCGSIVGDGGAHSFANVPGYLVAMGSGSLNFGNINLGNDGTLDVTFANVGTSRVTVSNVSVTGSGFNASGVPSGLVLGPGQTATVHITFAPASSGGAIGAITVASDAANSPSDVALSGTGVDFGHSISLAWTTSDSSNVIGYNIYASPVSGGPYTRLNTLPLAATEFTDGTVKSGGTYYYVVSSVAPNNVEGIFSEPIAVSVP